LRLPVSKQEGRIGKPLTGLTMPLFLPVSKQEGRIGKPLTGLTMPLFLPVSKQEGRVGIDNNEPLLWQTDNQ
jgi:hypothetical protein